MPRKIAREIGTEILIVLRVGPKEIQILQEIKTQKETERQILGE